MKMFKQTHPEDLISKMFILEYLNEIPFDILYKNANNYEKSRYFILNEMYESIDWKELLFNTSLEHLVSFIHKYMDEVTKVEERRKEKSQSMYNTSVDEASINLYDLARADMKKDKKLII